MYIDWLKVKGQKNINQIRARMAILIAYKIYFRMKKITRDTERHYILIKGSSYQEDIAVLNVYVTNYKTAKYVKQKLIELKGK